jgi:hypothetical protein
MIRAVVICAVDYSPKMSEVGMDILKYLKSLSLKNKTVNRHLSCKQKALFCTLIVKYNNFVTTNTI